ncbi:unnamed protein product [Effrenium voratum]|nr:unnamed protein product [Effrenium voratum]
MRTCSSSTTALRWAASSAAGRASQVPLSFLSALRRVSCHLRYGRCAACTGGWG